MMRAVPVVEAAGPVLVFGGPYSNLQATEAILAEARALAIPPERIICTGDLIAYCGRPDDTVSVVRDSGIHVVLGNCDEQIGAGGTDCACGFAADSDCGKLSAAWYAYADRHVAGHHRPWLAALPPRVDIALGTARLAVIHGGATLINQFHFATSSVAAKRADLDLLGVDGIVCGHSGLPFSEVIDGRLWHNAGVVGMPANDGTPRVWYSILTPAPHGITIKHRALAYDHQSAARDMHAAALPAEYRHSLASGLWPNCDILPAAETRIQGQPLTPATVPWNADSARIGSSTSTVLWPAHLTTQKPEAARALHADGFAGAFSAEVEAGSS